MKLVYTLWCAFLGSLIGLFMLPMFLYFIIFLLVLIIFLTGWLFDINLEFLVHPLNYIVPPFKVLAIIGWILGLFWGFVIGWFNLKESDLYGLEGIYRAAKQHILGLMRKSA